MLKLIKFAITIFFISMFFLNGRYNVSVDTGRPASQIEETYKAATWFGGIIKADPIKTCQNTGVAWVRTRVSVTGRLIALVTFGIYAPVEIKVRCAQG